ncbi:MAG: SCO family protein [Opitutales bacterium]|nr:SCO family protein [Opitutales bacterium]
MEYPKPNMHDRCNGFMGGARQFMTGAGLPVFLLTVTLLYEAFLLAVLFAPDGTGPWNRFAVEFKVWCFDYNPATGGIEWMAVWVMFLEPIFVTGIVLAIWRKGLGKLLRPQGWIEYWRALSAGTVTAVAVLVGMVSIGLPAEGDETVFPFPGERIRTQIKPPHFELTDHMGNPARLADLRGRVVLITGVYAHCTASCPMILLETRDLVDSLPQSALDHLIILAISLDPKGDSAEIMGQVANAYNFTYPEFRYLNGDADTMRSLLRSFNFSPTFNERTQQIDHANLFILVDIDGHIAYRFNLDPRHSSWIREAVMQLTREARQREGLRLSALEETHSF